MAAMGATHAETLGSRGVRTALLALIHRAIVSPT